MSRVLEVHTCRAATVARLAHCERCAFGVTLTKTYTFHARYVQPPFTTINIHWQLSVFVRNVRKHLTRTRAPFAANNVLCVHL
jgi:hypothetical protein